MRVLDESEERQLAKLLDDLNEYYSKRNIDILTSFRDFDRNKNGLVTENQVRLMQKVGLFYNR